MNNLDFNVAKASCTDEWIAKTYAEYLNSCAKSRADLMEKISDLCSNEQLETAVDAKVAELEQWLDDMSYRILYWIEQGESYEYQGQDLTQMKVTDTYYQEMFAYAISQNPDIINDFNDIMGSSASSANDILDDYILKYSVDDMAVKSSAIQSQINSLINDALTELKYNSQSVVALPDGFVNMKQLIKNVINNTVSGDNLGTFEIDGVDAQDTSIGKIAYSVNQFWDDSKTNFTSTMAWATGFIASTIENASDRINVFTSQMSTIISSGTSKMNNAFNTVKGIIAQANMNVNSFMDNAGSLLGWNQIDLNHVTMSDTDVYAYTGANPLMDIDLHSAKGIIMASAKTLGAIGKGIWDGIKNLAKKAVFKFRPALAAVSSNPYDIELINDSSISYTADTWCYNWTDTILFYDDSDQTDLTHRYAALTSHKNKWLKFSNIFGEILFRCNSVEYGEKTLNGVTKNGILINYTMQCKPRTLDVPNAVNYLCDDMGNDLRTMFYIPDPSNINYQSIVDKINSFKNCGKMYNEMTNSEEFMCIGFVLGMAGLTSVANLSAHELLDYYTAHNISHLDKFVTTTSTGLNVGSYVAEQQYIPTDASYISVDNADFIKAISGYKSDDNSTLKFAHHMTVSKSGSTFSIGPTRVSADMPTFYMPNIVYLFMELFLDKYVSPANYTYFPYSEENIVFDDAKFRVKTDADNINAANAFINSLVVVAVVAAIVATLGITFKIFKAKRVARLSSSVGVLDQKMWNGEKLTTSEALRYARKSKKLAKISGATSGLSTGSSVFDYVKETASKLGEFSMSDGGRFANYAGNSADVAIGAPVVSNSELINYLIRSINGKNVNDI